ncbi:unnamed protein product, partial [Meganyctiphanes norvegica]
IRGWKMHYHINDTVDLKCSSSPSHPEPHLSWKINNMPVPEDSVSDEQSYNTQDGLTYKISHLTFTAQSHHFIWGRMEVKCVASYTPQHTREGIAAAVQHDARHIFTPMENTLH